MIDNLINKEFIGIAFDSNDKLTYDKAKYDKYIGQIGIIKHINSFHPEYVCVVFTDGYYLYFPKKEVEDQINYSSNNSCIDDLYKKIFKTLEDNGR